jgi:peptidyl-prolyl cis-trans isomerase-like 4
LESLDGKHTIFGQVEEGLETLSKINNALTDKDGRPLQVRFEACAVYWIVV